MEDLGLAGGGGYFLGAFRRGGKGDFLFLYNCLAEENEALLPEGCFTDLETGNAVNGNLFLPLYDTGILFWPAARP